VHRFVLLSTGPLKMQDVKMTDQIAARENVGLENTTELITVNCKPVFK